MLNPANSGTHFLSIIKLFLQVLNPANSGTHFRHFRHFSSLSFFQKDAKKLLSPPNSKLRPLLFLKPI